MEFDQLFTAVQGVMRSHQNGTITKFNTVTKDNDNVSQKIVESIKALITELNLKDEHLRKINLLLIVNTDLPSVPLLEDDSNFWHLLGCLPKLSSYLYFRIVSDLQFGSFLGETIRLGPDFLGSELLHVMSENLNYLNPEVSVSFLEALYESTFYKINYLQNSNSLPIVIQKFVKLFQDITSYNMKQLIDDLPWETDKRYIYFGYIIKMLLSVLKNCIDKLKNKSVENVVGIYDFAVEFDYSKWGECKRQINWANHCLSLLVSKCAEAVMCISVDMYMAWCEVDMKNSVDKTLQTVIREEAYICREEIKSISHMNDDISNLKVLESSLSNIAVQPVTEDDEIKKADAETIILNLLNPKRTQSKWLKGLMCVPGIFQSSKYMKVIQDNAHLFDLEIATVLLDNLYDFLSTSQCPRDFFEVAKDLLFHCVKKMPLSTQLDLLLYFFNTKGNSCRLQRDNFEASLTIALNKISTVEENKDEMYSEFVILCFENCEVFMQTLLKECLSSDLKADLLLDLLTHITPLANISCSASTLNLTLGTTIHIMDTVISSLEKKKDNFLQLVKKLCVLGLIEGNIFFPAHVLPRLEKSFNDNDMESMVFFLDVLSVYIGINLVPNNTAALLAFLTKALDNLRPGITTFTVEKMLATSKLADFISKLTKNFIKSKNQQDNEILWLQKKILPLKPINTIHLRNLWTKWDQEMPDVPFWAQQGLGLNDKLIIASEQDRREVVTKLVKVLPVLTLSEWLLVGSLDNVNIRLTVSTVEAIVDSILVSFQIPFLIKNIHIINNLLINLSQFIWDKIIPQIKKNIEEGKVLKRVITHLQDMVPDDLQKSRRPQLQLIIQTINDTQNKKKC